MVFFGWFKNRQCFETSKKKTGIYECIAAKRFEKMFLITYGVPCL
jgi:hypothetical protein